MTVMQQQTSLRKSGLSYDKFSPEIWSRAYKFFCFYIPLFERWIMQIPGPSIVFFFFQGKMKFSPSAMCVCVCVMAWKNQGTQKHWRRNNVSRNNIVLIWCANIKFIYFCVFTSFWFDVLILKIFLKKIYFNVFLNEKQLLPQCQTLS
jgi:hypothetical protein